MWCPFTQESVMKKGWILGYSLWVPFLRPHRNTAYVDVTYCYWPSSMVCRSLCHTSVPCKNGCTYRDTIWIEDSAELKEPCIRCGSRSPHGNGAILRVEGQPIVKYWDTLWSSVKNGWTDQDAVWVISSDGPRNHLLDRGFQIPHRNR